MKMLLGPEDVREVDFEDGHPVKETDDNSTSNDNPVTPQSGPMVRPRPEPSASVPNGALADVPTNTPTADGK